MSIILYTIGILIVVGMAFYSVMMLYLKIKGGDAAIVLDTKRATALLYNHTAMFFLSMVLCLGMICSVAAKQDTPDRILERESLIGRAFISKSPENPNVYEVTIMSSDATTQTVIRLTKGELENFKARAEDSLK